MVRRAGDVDFSFQRSEATQITCFSTEFAQYHLCGSNCRVFRRAHDLPCRDLNCLACTL